MPFGHLANRQLQCCHYAHLQKVRNTRAVESVGRTLMAPGAVINTAVLIDFSLQVCRWGGRTGSRVFWRIRKTPAPMLVVSFTQAIAALKKTPPALLAAKTSLGPISGLGAFSYSSKHLRMLAPEISPVLDGIIDHYLVTKSPRYARSAIDQRFLGYADFCQAKALELTAKRVTLGDFLPSADGGTLMTTSISAHCKWNAADVDMACFAWLQGWYAGGGATSTISGQTPTTPRPAQIEPNAEGKRTLDIPNTTRRPTIFLAQDHKRDTAVTIKEACGRRWNNAWICRSHGSLDFKNGGAKGTTRHLISEILTQGVDVTQDPDWEPSHDGKTCHHEGSDYQGRLNTGTVEDAVRYLKRFFIVQACPKNETETQAWIDAL